MSQVVDLSNKSEALSSNPSTMKKRKKKVTVNSANYEIFKIQVHLAKINTF
jgi:hypothetical protein